jgi:hypothetical protein
LATPKIPGLDGKKKILESINYTGLIKITRTVFLPRFVAPKMKEPREGRYRICGRSLDRLPEYAT